MAGAMRSIPTEYRVLWRSKLEAEWAKNLTEQLRIAWINEPEGIKLPSGTNYLCDVFCPGQNLWIEVKGPHDARIQKPAELAVACRHDPLCGTSTVQHPMLRPKGAKPSKCECGFGYDFPWRLVIIGRPAVGGRMLWEPVQGEEDRNLVLVECPRRHRYTWVDLNGLPLCRCCHLDLTGQPAIPAKRLKWLTIDPMAKRRPRKKVVKAA